MVRSADAQSGRNRQAIRFRKNGLIKLAIKGAVAMRGVFLDGDGIVGEEFAIRVRKLTGIAVDGLVARGAPAHSDVLPLVPILDRREGEQRLAHAVERL